MELSQDGYRIEHRGSEPGPSCNHVIPRGLHTVAGFLKMLEASKTQSRLLTKILVT